MRRTPFTMHLLRDDVDVYSDVNTNMYVRSMMSNRKAVDNDNDVTTTHIATNNKTTANANNKAHTISHANTLIGDAYRF